MTIDSTMPETIGKKVTAVTAVTDAKKCRNPHEQGLVTAVTDKQPSPIHARAPTRALRENNRNCRNCRDFPLSMRVTAFSGWWFIRDLAVTGWLLAGAAA